MLPLHSLSHFFFFNDTATTEIYTLSLHDALPISKLVGEYYCQVFARTYGLETVSLRYFNVFGPRQDPGRSEEHTSELQSQSNLVCRLLLEKKKSLHRSSRSASYSDSSFATSITQR